MTSGSPFRSPEVILLHISRRTSRFVSGDLICIPQSSLSGRAQAGNLYPKNRKRRNAKSGSSSSRSWRCLASIFASSQFESLTRANGCPCSKIVEPTQTLHTHAEAAAKPPQGITRLDFIEFSPFGIDLFRLRT